MSNENALTSENSEIILITGYTQQEVEDCIEYVQLRDSDISEKKPMSLSEYAAKMDISDRQMYRWLADWRENGLLEKVREIMLRQRKEDLVVLKVQVLGAWSHVMRRVIKVATDSNSDRNAIDAARLIFDIYGTDIMGQEDNAGSDEAKFAAASQKFKPYNLE